MGGSNKHYQFFRIRSAIELNDEQTGGNDWLCRSLKYIDIDKRWLLLQSFEIAKSSMGGITVMELRNLTWTDYKLLLDSMREKDNA